MDPGPRPAAPGAPAGRSSPGAVAPAGVVMGIYDREYYRDGSRGPGFFSGEWSTCKALIWANVTVFVLQWLLAADPGRAGTDPLSAWFDADSAAIFGELQVWRLLSYAFLHGGPIHLLFNMLFLWMAGREVESIYGKWEFLAFYLTAAVFSGLCWAALDYFGPNPPGVLPGRAMGASGAVAAVIVVYAMFYPRREVLLFFILPMPMWLFVVFFLGMDALGLIQELRGESGAMVAFAAHLGGAAYGFGYKRLDLRLTKLMDWRRLGRPRLRVYAPEGRGRRVTPSVGTPGRATAARPNAPSTGSPMAQFPDDHLDARVDEILAKIAREGRGGLTEEENRILEEASLRARHRRGERL